MISASPWRNWKKRKAAGLNRQKQLEKKLLCHRRIIWNRRNGPQTGSMGDGPSRAAGQSYRTCGPAGGRGGKPCRSAVPLEHPHVAGTGEDVPDEEQLNRLSGGV